MSKYFISKSEIEKIEGTQKQHFLNPNAIRINKSLGDAAGLTKIGFHIIEIPRGCYSTEAHVHYFEDECVYVLSGTGKAIIGVEEHAIGPGDFIGYRAGGEAHTIQNTGSEPLKAIVVGSRLDHDVADYPNLGKRLFRNNGMDWFLTNKDGENIPKSAGKK